MTIIEFPKRYRSAETEDLSCPSIPTVRPRVPWRTVWSVFQILAMILRIPVFLVLYWLRLPVMFVANLVSIPTLLAFLFSLYAFPDKTQMVLAFGVVSFLAFSLQYLYDLILMSLAPQEMMRTL